MPQLASGWTPYNTSSSPWASNQSMSFPNINPGQTPGVVPQQMNFTSQNFNATDPWGYSTGGANALAGGMQTQPTMSPQFTQEWFNYLNNQLGRGVSPFGLSAIMPSSGAATIPGTLSAPLTGTLADLQKFFQGGSSGMPGLNFLGDVASKGISALPEWQAMLAAQQRQTDVNAADLREQFGFAGNLESSPFAGAMTDFYNQNALNQNALLAQLTQQNLGTQIGVGENLTGMGMQLGDLFQNLDQNSINALYNEFVRTSPQNNPMMSFIGQGAMSTPSMYQPVQSSIFGDIGSLLGGIGGAAFGLGGLSGIGSLFGGGGENSLGKKGSSPFSQPAMIPGLG